MSDPVPPTPGQTVGPFFAIGLPYAGDADLLAPDDPRAIRLHGTLYDGYDAAVPDGMLEIWQADEHGKVPRVPGSLQRNRREFTGFGRASTDAAGHFQFHTLLPGIAPDATQRAPFIAVAVFSRGLIDRLHTRIYLPQYAERNAADPLLTQLTPAERATLTAVLEPDGALRHDIHLQGERETVFLAFR